jgi:hypothetical protein
MSFPGSSYLRAYARYLGLDEDRALNAYDYSVKERRTTADDESSFERASLPVWLRWVAIGIFVAVPAVLLLRALPQTRERAAAPPSVGGASGPPAPTRATPPWEAQQAPNPFPGNLGTPPPGSPASLEPTAALPDDGALRLSLSVEEACWLEIEADGVVVVSGLKEVGFRDEVSARHEVRLWLGNAGGVKLSVNDRPVRPLGRPGQVRRDLTITTENYRDYILSAGGGR